MEHRDNDRLGEKSHAVDILERTAPWIVAAIAAGVVLLALGMEILQRW